MPDRCGIVVYSVADYWEDASCEIDESGALFAAAAAAALGGGADTTDDSVRLITEKTTRPMSRSIKCDASSICRGQWMAPVGCLSAGCWVLTFWHFTFYYFLGV